MRDAASPLELAERVLMPCVFAARHIDVMRQVVRDTAAQLIAHLKRSFDGGIAHRPSPGNWQTLIEVEAALAALLMQWPVLGLEQPRALRWSDDAIARSAGFAGILATRIAARPASRSALHSVHAPLHTRLKNRHHREIGDACRCLR
ncbi:hypothetical protein [Xanthomonas oryzae]|uniref:hypothetical protein n=1 Tax=Xanthomonas oryzae TaxID=347 RepID=UPI001F5E6B3C|nr:hypothetical protein [Xanthomonas oryzae]